MIAATGARSECRFRAIPVPTLHRHPGLFLATAAANCKPQSRATQLSHQNLIHDRAANRFRLPLDHGGEAFIEYVEQGSGTLDLLHTVVPPEARDKGIGSMIVEQVLHYARDQDLRIVPSCAFVAAYLQEHPEYRDLVA